MFKLNACSVEIHDVDCISGVARGGMGEHPQLQLRIQICAVILTKFIPTTCIFRAFHAQKCICPGPCWGSFQCSHNPPSWC